MKYLWIIVLLCVSCQTITKSTTNDDISKQIRAYEDELKAIVSLNLAMTDYQKGETSLDMCKYRIDMYMYTRKKNKKEGFLLGIALSENPIKEEFKKSEDYLLDEIRAWHKKHY